MDRITVKALFLKALQSGGRQLGPFEVEWEIAGRCLMPVRREVSARKGQGFSITKPRRRVHSALAIEDTFHDWVNDEPLTLNYGADKVGPYAIYLTVKCRMCDECLKERKIAWANRALVEYERASRVWFGTLTLEPQWQSLFGAQAAQRAAKNGDVLEALPFDTQLHLRHQAAAVEITKMWKRLRKAGHRFRYFVVLEAHKSGLPHYHAMLFEQSAPVTKRELDAEWPCGFTKWKLAEDSGRVWYVAKYLGKSSAARVRASLNFGGDKRALAVANEPVQREKHPSQSAVKPRFTSPSLWESRLSETQIRPDGDLMVAASDRDLHRQE